MKIVKKIRFYRESKEFFRFSTGCLNAAIMELCQAYSISGEFNAYSDLKDEETGLPASRIIYYPTDDQYNTPNELNFRLEGENTIQIPPGTKSITVVVAPRDNVRIYAQMYEEYILIDEDGKEIPIQIKRNKEDQ